MVLLMQEALSANHLFQGIELFVCGLQSKLLLGQVGNNSFDSWSKGTGLSLFASGGKANYRFKDSLQCIAIK